MTIEEIQAAKHELTEAVTKLIQDFNTKSPLKVEEIKVSNVRHESYDSAQSFSRLTGVSVRLSEI